MLSSPERSGLPQPDATTAEPSRLGHEPSLADVLTSAESLDPKDRVRLIAHLLESLPPKYRAVIFEYWQQWLKPATGKPRIRIVPPRVVPVGPTLWERLFDPAKTSELYSAPRRFDLATIFVVTAAYSILFGAMKAFDYYFGPVTQVAVGILVTVVAVTQAFYKDIANPRGVSIVTGAIAQTVILVLIKIFSPHLLPGPGFVVVVIYGLLGGAVSGYLAGVLVGGVFLVADALRKRFSKHSNLDEDESISQPESTERGDSPWEN